MSKKKKSYAKQIIIVIALIGFAIAGYFIYQQWVAAAEYNRLVDLVNTGEYKQAVDGFEKLMKTAPPNIAAKSKLEAAVAYRMLGDDTAASLQDGAGYLRRAEELDPGSLTPEQKKLIETADRARELSR